MRMDDIITSKTDGIFKLYALISILKNFVEGRVCSVLEVTLLEEFPTGMVFLFIERFSPKHTDY